MYLDDVDEFAKENKMKINYKKTKVMVFSRAKKIDFPLEVSFPGGEILERLTEVKLLGVMITDNLSWQSNTDYICSKARKKIWLLRSMKFAGLTQSELVDAYCKEVRSLLELAVPLWNSALTIKQCQQIERIQKTALAVILDHKFINYENACKMTNIVTLKIRREKICLKFIKKNLESDTPLLTPHSSSINTRSKPKIVKEFNCRTTAFKKSSLPYLARLANSNL